VGAHERSFCRICYWNFTVSRRRRIEHRVCSEGFERGLPSCAFCLYSWLLPICFAIIIAQKHSEPLRAKPTLLCVRRIKIVETTTFMCIIGWRVEANWWDIKMWKDGCLVTEHWTSGVGSVENMGSHARATSFLLFRKNCFTFSFDMCRVSCLLGVRGSSTKFMGHQDIKNWCLVTKHGTWDVGSMRGFARTRLRFSL